MTRACEEIFGLAILAVSAVLYVPSIMICGPVIARRYRQQMRRYGR